MIERRDELTTEDLPVRTPAENATRGAGKADGEVLEDEDH
jgi:hypothetical protein